MLKKKCQIEIFNLMANKFMFLVHITIKSVKMLFNAFFGIHST